MFEDTNRLRFDVPLDDVSRQWWIERFAEPFGLTPEDVGDLLSRSWTQEKSMRVTELDGRHERFSITVDGRFGGGDFWFHARTLDLRGGFLNARLATA